MSRSRLIAVLCYCGLSACSAAPLSERARAGEEFNRLKTAYLEFCDKPEAFVTKPFASPEGRSIVAMGKRAMPFVIEDIRSGESQWKWAAFHIVAPTPVPDDATWEEIVRTRNEDLIERSSRDWVKWWDENRNSSEWNVFRDDPWAPPPQSPPLCLRVFVF
jgi:hypothetical protein